MKATFRIGSLIAGIAAAALGFSTVRSAADESPSAPKQSRWTFSLLPKAFQRNPELEMTAHTDLTDYGRLWRTPTAESPIYYMLFSSGFKARGEPTGGEHPPPPREIERALARALGADHYLPAAVSKHPPQLIVFYFWGSHYRPDLEERLNFPELAQQYRLERAMLVGGKAEVERNANLLEFGESLLDRDPRYEFVRDQEMDDMYYVVASAYDYQALAHKQRKLVWRTSMTVNARGVSMGETLVPLIASAGPYLGRETKDTIVLTRNVARGKVLFGEPKVIQYEDNTPAAGARSPTK